MNTLVDIPQTIALDEQLLGYFAAQYMPAGKQHIVSVASNKRMYKVAEEIAAINPNLSIFMLPEWDVQPYGLSAPSKDILGHQYATLLALHMQSTGIYLVTPRSILNLYPNTINSSTKVVLTKGEDYPRQALIESLINTGYTRADAVYHIGEFAVRGDIIDIFPSTFTEPLRLEFFDDTLESLSLFSLFTQRRTEALNKVGILPINNNLLAPENVTRFRSLYRELQNAQTNDEIYTDISALHETSAMYDYLPLLTPHTELFSRFSQPHYWLPKHYEDLFANVRQAYEDAYDLRQAYPSEQGQPLPPEHYVDMQGLAKHITPASRTLLDVSSIDNAKIEPLILHKTSAAQKLATLKKAVQKYHNYTVVTSQEGAFIDTVETFMKSLNVTKSANPSYMSLIDHMARKIIVVPHTFETIIKPKKTKGVKGSTDALFAFSQLKNNDYVVHEDHGVAQFKGLKRLTVSDIESDYIVLHYAGDDKLFLPVENLHLISRYKGEDAEHITLDKLGGTEWITRKEKVKKDLFAIAHDLLSTAAERQIARAQQRYTLPGELYQEFCAGFPYETTDEQQAAIDDVLNDMFGTSLMDRLVVGDVGFGKTEVALRAAFIAAANGKQVAVVVPTTLLARQHYDNFKSRFNAFAINVVQLSRLVSSQQAKDNKEQLEKGTADIVIGTHAVLASSLNFKDLGLVIIDEEQHFGVKQKEKLKSLKADIDVLTLTATPIPRTLQMAVGGVRQLSLISSPPRDRLAVKSYVQQWDPHNITTAINFELGRGGQVYIVTPQVRDLRELEKNIRILVPQAKVVVAHGKLGEKALEEATLKFYSGKVDILLATNIIESGLDVPNANTLIVNRADRFGLSQLHQLRGRVGRSHTQAHAYFILPQGTTNEATINRLRVLQCYDELGAGFMLASYDMDMRGFGNILGEDQSGDVQAVGFELYTKMLRETLYKIKQRKLEKKAQVGETLGDENAGKSAFTPTLNLGVSYAIPADYIAEMQVRLQLYRRLANLTNDEEVTEFKAEIADRFGHIPQVCESLFRIVTLRNTCKTLNIYKLDLGEKGALIEFYNNSFSYPEALLSLIMRNKGIIELRPDQRVVFRGTYGSEKQRLDFAEWIITQLTNLVEEQQPK